jgi:hypothetical protein
VPVELGPDVEERSAAADDHPVTVFGLDPAYPEVLRGSDETIAVSPSTGRLLQVLIAALGACWRSARSASTRRCGWWALPEGGQVVSLESNPTMPTWLARTLPPQASATSWRSGSVMRG